MIKKTLIILGILVVAVSSAALTVKYADQVETSMPYQLFMIQSGSMEPSIMTGDVVLVQRTQQYQVNDVITYYDPEHRVVTHRILELDNQSPGKTTFQTKGDANQTSDNYLIDLSQVIGEVTLVIPKLGYLVALSKSRYGLFAAVLVPMIIIVADQLKVIVSELNKNHG